METIFRMIASGDFEMNFASTYPSFAENLVSTYEELSLQEIKICMCIKMCYSNAQIQDQLDISQSTLFNLRSSIRKKMKLKKTDNLKKRVICF